jgi:hypothetical protein
MARKGCSQTVQGNYGKDAQRNWHEMIKETDIENAVDFLHDNSTKIAAAKANAMHLEDYTKVIKAKIMRENANLSLGAQEAIAYSDSRYSAHLDAKKIADEEYERLRWLMDATDAKIRAWQTMSSNNRKGF